MKCIFFRVPSRKRSQYINSTHHVLLLLLARSRCCAKQQGTTKTLLYVESNFSPKSAGREAQSIDHASIKHAFSRDCATQ
jgi:hypothetical protein